MSRNDQVIRQWFLLQKLGSERGVTLQELAAALPEDYSCHPRTIRRDLEALDAAHFPLLAERVGGQTRWRLMDGYRHVPALTFSPTELMALVFSRDLLKPLDGTYLKASLDSAFNKAAAALPAEGMVYVQQMQSYFSVGLGPHKSYRQHQHTIDQLTRAITQTRTVQIRYYAASRDNLVDEVKRFDDNAAMEGTIFLLADRGRLTLPVWVDHVGSEGTRYVTGDLLPLPLVAPDTGRLPKIEPPEPPASSPKKKGK
jgi:predicted DNA-binding transcriptional regulator YafY